MQNYSIGTGDLFWVVALFFRPFYFAVNIDFSERGRRGCWGCSLPLAGLLAGKPLQKLSCITGGFFTKRSINLCRNNLKYLNFDIVE